MLHSSVCEIIIVIIVLEIFPKKCKAIIQVICVLNCLINFITCNNAHSSCLWSILLIDYCDSVCASVIV